MELPNEEMINLSNETRDLTEEIVTIVEDIYTAILNCKAGIPTLGLDELKITKQNLEAIKKTLETVKTIVQHIWKDSEKEKEA